VVTGDSNKGFVLNNFEDEDALNNFEVEITDLDPDHGEVRASVLWLYGQRLWSRTGLRMALLTILGVVVLGVTLLSPLLVQLSRGPQQTRGKQVITRSFPHETICSRVLVSITALSTNDGTTLWQGVNIVQGKPGVVAASCVQIIDVQMVPDGNGTIYWFRGR
jgi:hypothetical protein